MVCELYLNKAVLKKRKIKSHRSMCYMDYFLKKHDVMT